MDLSGQNMEKIAMDLTEYPLTVLAAHGQHPVKEEHYPETLTEGLTYLLWFTKRGRAAFSLRGKTIPFQSANALLIPLRKQRLRLHISEKQTLLGCYVIFKINAPKKKLATLSRAARIELCTIASNTYLVHNFHRITTALKLGNHGHAEIWLKAILCHFYEVLNNKKELYYSAADREHIERVDELCADIERGIFSISLEEAAMRCHYSKYHFIRVFKEVTGRTFNQYLIDHKMRRATYLILNKNMTMREIAESLGYNDELYFSKQFRQRIGYSPREFARNKRRMRDA